MTFSVEVFPPGGTYTWTLDGAPLSNTGKSYVYTAEAGNHTLVVKATHFLGTDTQTWNIITPSPPVANAGPDQTVAVDVTVTLDGSGSTDPDNNIASYQWQQLDGPTVTLSNADTAIAQFTANVTVGSTLTFKLTVTDATNLQATDTCVITVTNLSDPIISLLNSLVPIPAGSFMMGSTDDEYGWAQTTTPVHQVTFQAFDIGAYEVTQAQYLALMGTNPSYFQGTSYPNSENNPVEWVSWYEARAFCTALSAMTGRTFTLPSESQWEYACRAGTTTLYSFGDSYALLDKYAWTWANSDGTGGPYGTHPIGTKLPNNWGLYDMMGNASEFCLDSWHTNYVGAPTDGSAWEPETGSVRVIRDGHFFVGSAWTHQSAFRTDMPSVGTGFRVVEIP
jgi:formylglycine-generating enzyme required for sulfatase activity